MTTDLPNREEYIEQAYFFRVFRERLADKIPAQEILETVHEEILATTRLPMAIEFLKGEILLNGRMSDGMQRLGHYFCPFQSFVMSRAEDDKSKFDQTTALLVLEREAEYRSNSPTPSGLFIYQFECLARNRLGYHDGMQAIADDPIYDEEWAAWVLNLRRHLGARDLAEIIYTASGYRPGRRTVSEQSSEEGGNKLALFDEKSGRIARANSGRDPLYMFAALQRQLGYPTVPKPARRSAAPVIHPVLEQRLKHLETRLKLLEAENKGGIDLSEFYKRLGGDIATDDSEPDSE